MQGKSGEEEVEEGEEREVVVVTKSLKGKGMVILSGCGFPTQKLLFFLGSCISPPIFLLSVNPF